MRHGTQPAHASSCPATVPALEGAGMKGTRIGLWMLPMALACAACWPWAASAASGGNLEIKVLSDRSDVISGGDALVAVHVPRGTSPGQVRMTLNGRNVTSQFAMRPNGRYEGKLEGLTLGANVLEASAPG